MADLEQVNAKKDNEINIYEYLPFNHDKICKLIKSGQLPVRKNGKRYVTTEAKLNKWINDHIGQEIIY